MSWRSAGESFQKSEPRAACCGAVANKESSGQLGNDSCKITYKLKDLNAFIASYHVHNGRKRELCGGGSASHNMKPTMFSSGTRNIVYEIHDEAQGALLLIFDIQISISLLFNMGSTRTFPNDPEHLFALGCSGQVLIPISRDQDVVFYTDSADSQVFLQDRCVDES
jgi:hypothetical protein